jgi:subtilase family serine protease
MVPIGLAVVVLGLAPCTSSSGSEQQLVSASYPSPFSARCVSSDAVEPCYTALQLQKAYNLEPLYAKGLDGSGTTVVVLAARVSPTLVHDLAVFDEALRLQTPSIRVVSPAGTVPARFDPDSIQSAIDFSSECTLDVEAVHTIAPGANIVVFAAPSGAVSSNLSDVIWQASAMRYVALHHLGEVITSSQASVGESAIGSSTINRLHEDYQYAAVHHVSVIQASGDFGASSRDLVGVFTRRMRGYPASDPLVTAVGATQLHLDAQGNRTSPDTVAATPSGGFASGGGLSEVFPRPSYQNAAESVVGDHRGGPDVSMSGDPNGGFELYMSFPKGSIAASIRGWGSGGGTSVSAPLFAGIAAIADQAAGRPLGPLNPYLYIAYQLPNHGGLQRSSLPTARPRRSQAMKHRLATTSQLVSVRWTLQCWSKRCPSLRRTRRVLHQLFDCPILAAG